MYGIVQMTTSLRRDEADRLDVISAKVGARRFRRAGTLRAMLRYVLAHEDEFLTWFRETEGQPFAGGEES